jgi:hypothetical protein
MSKYEEKIKYLPFRYLDEGDHKQPTEQNIKQIEDQIGYTLPPNYLDFLINYGGIAFNSYVEFPYLEACPWGDKGMIDVFFGILDSTYDLIRNFKTYRGRVPFNFLPIASDPGGNIICLEINDNNKGRVYFWDKDQEEMVNIGEEPRYSNIYLIENSFDDFINSLELMQTDEDE